MKLRINFLKHMTHTKIWSLGSLFACAAFMLPIGYSYAAQPLGCMIEPERIAEVGSPVVGIVESVSVERGDMVRKGQILATLRSDVERASVQVAGTRSQAEAGVRSAEAALELAHVTEKREKDLVEKKFISQQALDKSHAETAMTAQKLALAHEQLRTWNSELSLALAQLGQRTIRSPIDGIIADRYIWPGERVEEKPMFRVAKISPLRVEMVVTAALYGTISKDMQLSIIPQLPNTQPLQANVVLVDKLIDGPSNTFRVRAEIPNKDSAIPSGISCKVELPDPAPSVAANTVSALPERIPAKENNEISLPAKSPVSYPAKSQKPNLQPNKLRLDTQLKQNNAIKTTSHPTTMYRRLKVKQQPIK